ncbi:hypothetical protein HDV57DRAFT_484823 [Trichoderma longibrachiatum]
MVGLGPRPPPSRKGTLICSSSFTAISLFRSGFFHVHLLQFLLPAALAQCPLHPSFDAHSGPSQAIVPQDTRQHSPVSKWLQTTRTPHSGSVSTITERTPCKSEA